MQTESAKSQELQLCQHGHAGRASWKMRYVVFALLAVFFVCLPVMPLRFLGIPGPSTGSHQIYVSAIGAWWDSLGLAKNANHKQVPGKVLGSDAKEVAAQARILKQAEGELVLEIGRCPQNPSLENRLGLIELALCRKDEAKSHFERAKALARLSIANASRKLNALNVENKATSASALMIALTNAKVELSAAHSNLACLYQEENKHNDMVRELAEWSGESSIANLPQEKKMVVSKPFLPEIQNLPKAQRQAAVLPDEKKMPSASSEESGRLANAQALLKSGHVSEACTLLKVLVGENSQIAEAHTALGLCYLDLKDVAAAGDELEKSLALDGKNASVHNNLGLVYAQLGKTGQAKNEFERALDLNPKLSAAALNLGILCANDAHFAQAKSAYEKAIKADPKSAVAYNNLAAINCMEGKNAEAIAEFRQAIGCVPNLASAHYGLGTALSNAGAYLPAIQEFKMAIALDPSLQDAENKIEIASRKAALRGLGSH